MPSVLIRLARAFLARFFENDLTTGAGDLRRLFFAGIAILALPGVVAPMLMAGAGSSGDPATWGWAMVARAGGIDALREMALADKTLYLGLATIIALLLSAATWPSLLPDRRDTLVLGPLPVRPATIVGARVIALAAFCGLTATAIHALSALAFGSLLAVGNTPVFALRGIAAHFLASTGAAIFAMLAVTGLQGTIAAVFGPRLFARLSPLLQWAVVSAAMLQLVGLPSMSAAVLDTLRGSGEHIRPWILATPALWFLGLYERIVGTSDPILTVLANRAAMAFTIAAVVTLVTQPITAWRISRTAMQGLAGRHVRRTTTARVIDMLSRILGRGSEVRAVGSFYFASIARGPRQRLVMAGAIGAAMAWGLPGWLTLARRVPAEPALGLVAWPVAGLAFVLVGLRLAAALPVDSAAAWIFSTQPLDRRTVARAVSRAVLLVGVLPFAAGFALLYWHWWGADAALTHLASSFAEGWLLIQVLRWPDDRVPGTSAMSFDPARLRHWWPVYLLGFVYVTAVMPAIEWVALTNRIVAILSVLAYLGLAGLVRALYRRRDAAGTSRDDAAEVLTVALRSGSVTQNAEGEPEWGRASTVAERRNRATATELFERPRLTMPDSDRWFDGVSFAPRELARDVRLASRRLARTPAFAVFAVVTLAAGAGVTAADYSFITALAPTERLAGDSRLMVVRSAAGGGLSWPDFQDLAARQTTFAAIGGQFDFPGSIAWRGVATLADGVLVTGDYFRALGVAPALGRLIQSADDRPDAAPVVVITDVLWRTRFGGDSSIVGDLVTLSGERYQVIGVLPASFHGFGGGTNRPRWFYVPHARAPLTDRAVARFRDSSRRDRAYLFVVGRLADGVSSARAGAEIAGVGKALDASDPLTVRTSSEAVRPRSRYWSTRPLAEIVRDRVPLSVLVAYLALPALVLLIACTNLSNLVLSRGAAREHESAVCRAMGASRWTLVREHLVELGLIAALGGAGAIVVARAIIVLGQRYFQSTYPDLAQYQLDVPIDWRAGILVFGACVLALTIAGLIPAITLTRGGVAPILAGSQHTAGPRWRGRARLIAGQVATSVVLLLVGALAVRSVMATDRLHPGALPLERLAVVSVPFSLQQGDSARIQRDVDEVLRRLRADPAVASAAAFAGLPDVDPRNGVDATTIDRPFELNVEPLHPASLVIGTTSLFETLGVRLEAGRPFTDADEAGAPLVTILNAHFARGVFGTADVVGRRIRLRTTGISAASATIAFEAADRDGTLAIVGVATDTTSSRTGEIQDVAYVPLAQHVETDLTFVARAADASAASAASLVTLVKTSIRQIDGNVAIGFSGRADVRAGAEVVILKMIAVVAGGLAIVALVLAMSGLYGVLSHVVRRRRREMGIRLAIGADPGALVRMVMIEGARPVAVGLAIGVGVAAVARLSAQPFLVRLVSAVDPLAVVLAGAPLVIAAAVACYLPARHAAKTDPNAALKQF